MIKDELLATALDCYVCFLSAVNDEHLIWFPISMKSQLVLEELPQRRISSTFSVPSLLCRLE